MKKVLSAVACLALTTMVFAQETQMKPEETEFYDPVPPVVTPGQNYGDPPSDAIILFDGKNLDEWQSVQDSSQPAGWVVKDNVITVDKSKGDIETKRKFKDYQLHIEFRIPSNITGSGQARGNSGIFLAAPHGASEYELQVLDNYNNKTYVNGQVGSIYKQSIPLANPSRKPGEWQAYDVVWTAPRFYDNGQLESPARVTAFLNNVLVQNNFVLRGSTPYIGLPKYVRHGAAPIKLQAHGDKSEPISFRKIWIRPIEPLK